MFNCVFGGLGEGVSFFGIIRCLFSKMLIDWLIICSKFEVKCGMVKVGFIFGCYV